MKEDTKNIFFGSLILICLSALITVVLTILSNWNINNSTTTKCLEVKKVYVFHDVLSSPYILILAHPTQKDHEYCIEDSNCMDVLPLAESGLPTRKDAPNVH